MTGNSPCDREYTGPLATTAQIALERRALELIKHPDVVACRARTAETLRQDPVNALPDGAATLEASLDQWMMTLVQWELCGDTTQPEIIWTVEDSPKCWFGHQITGAAVAGDNPDHIYRNAFLDGDSDYVLEGKVPQNGPAQLALEIYRGSPSTTPMTRQSAKSPDLGNQVSLIATSGMEIDADGRFSVTIGKNPGPVAANHLLLDDGAMTLAARDMLSDWTQEPVALAIRRVGGPDRPPLDMSDEGVIARIVEGLPGFVTFWSGFKNMWLGGISDNHVTGPVARDGGWGYLAAGRFNLAEDEALVFETEDGGAPYTGFQVMNLWMVLHKPAFDATVCLNSAQVARNPDGSITYVLARRDPGVANWIDTGGLAHGIFLLRWQIVPKDADPARLLLTMRQVKLADLDSMIAPDVPRMDAAGRAAQLAARREAFDHRLGRQETTENSN